MHGTCIRNMFFLLLLQMEGWMTASLSPNLTKLGTNRNISWNIESFSCLVRSKLSLLLTFEENVPSHYWTKQNLCFPTWIKMLEYFLPEFFLKKLSDWIVLRALANISFTIEENVQMQYIWYVPYFTLFRTHFSTLWCTTLNRKLYLLTRVKFE